MLWICFDTPKKKKKKKKKKCFEFVSTHQNETNFIKLQVRSLIRNLWHASCVSLEDYLGGNEVEWTWNESTGNAAFLCGHCQRPSHDLSRPSSIVLCYHADRSRWDVDAKSVVWTALKEKGQLKRWMSFFNPQCGEFKDIYKNRHIDKAKSVVWTALKEKGQLKRWVSFFNPQCGEFKDIYRNHHIDKENKK